MPTFKTLFKNSKNSETEIAANESLTKLQKMISPKIRIFESFFMGTANDQRKPSLISQKQNIEGYKRK